MPFSFAYAHREYVPLRAFALALDKNDAVNLRRVVPAIAVHSKPASVGDFGLHFDEAVKVLVDLVTNI
jgi:hypothetical protein